MIKSMTGFAKVELVKHNLVCQVEMRSVNHRHLEARINLPRAYQHWEEDLKKGLRNHVQRGKLDAQLNLERSGEAAERLKLDPHALADLQSLKGQLETALGQPISLSMGDLLQFKGLIGYAQPDLDEAMVLALMNDAMDQAAQGLAAMRLREGELLAGEMLTRLDYMAGLVGQVPAFRDEVIARYKERLKEAMETLAGTVNPDDPRILAEVGIFIDKSDVTEEVERFRTHLTHFRELIHSEEAVGRKLDFLLQEFNREANTLCSKAGHAKISEIGVTLKVEIEKLREQVQNIE